MTGMSTTDSVRRLMTAVKADWPAVTYHPDDPDRPTIEALAAELGLVAIPDATLAWGDILGSGEPLPLPPPSSRHETLHIHGLWLIRSPTGAHRVLVDVADEETGEGSLRRVPFDTGDPVSRYVPVAEIRAAPAERWELA